MKETSTFYSFASESKPNYDTTVYTNTSLLRRPPLLSASRTVMTSTAGLYKWWEGVNSLNWFSSDTQYPYSAYIMTEKGGGVNRVHVKHKHKGPQLGGRGAI